MLSLKHQLNLKLENEEDADILERAYEYGYAIDQIEKIRAWLLERGFRMVELGEVLDENKVYARAWEQSWDFVRGDGLKVDRGVVIFAEPIEPTFDPLKDEHKLFTLEEWADTLCAEVRRFQRDASKEKSREPLTWDAWLTLFCKRFT